MELKNLTLHNLMVDGIQYHLGNLQYSDYQNLFYITLL
jgi:hypothetical protein